METAALEESQTAAQVTWFAVFGLARKPSSHSLVGYSLDKRAAGLATRRLSARQMRADHSRGGEPSREVAAAARCENTKGCG